MERYCNECGEYFENDFSNACPACGSDYTTSDNDQGIGEE